MRGSEDAPRDPFDLLQRRQGLAEVVECGAGVYVERPRARFVQSRFDERRLRIVLPKIKELQGLVSARDFGPFKGFLVAADVLPLQEDLARFTNALRWALYSWGDDGERANVFFADFAKDGYQAKGYFGFVDECGDYSPWGHTWAVGTRAELDAAGWAEEAFPNEDVADY